MIRMQRDRTARRRIREYLDSTGPIDDPSGYATSLLKDAIDYTGSPVAFIQLVASMDNANEIEREVRGKRTYRIASAASSTRTSAPPAAGGGMPSERSNHALRDDITVESILGESFDYSRLARAIVRELWDVAANQITPGAPYPVAEPSTQSASGVADQDALTAERDEYARRLEIARRSLDELLGAGAEHEAAKS